MFKHALNGRVDLDNLNIRQLIDGWTRRVNEGEFDGHN